MRTASHSLLLTLALACAPTEARADAASPDDAGAGDVRPSSLAPPLVEAQPEPVDTPQGAALERDAAPSFERAAEEDAAVPADAPLSYEQLRAKAARALEAGRFDDAAAALEAAIADFPQDFALRLELGFARLRGGRYVEAETAYRVALALNDASYEARWGLADALLAQRRWPEARAAYEAMLAARPGDLEARLGIARTLAGEERWAELRDATNALLLDHDDARAQSLHALAHFWLGDLREARAHYERAVALAPDDADARLGLAWVAQRRGQTRAARGGFEGVLGDQPGTPGARSAALTGLAALAPEHEVLVQAHGLVQSASGHPVRGLEYGAVLGVDARLGDSWLLGGRFRHVGPLDTKGNAPGFSNDEGWLTLGFTGARFSASLYGAGVVFTPGAGATSTLTESGWAVGAAASVRAWADWKASVVASVYPDGVVGQGELGAALPLGRFVTLSLAGRGQWAQQRARFAGLGLLELHGARWSLGLGGGYGTQLHPVELDSMALYNLTDEQPWRATARGHVQLGRYVLLFASGDVEAWRTTADTGVTDSLLFRGVIGLGFSFPGG